MHFLKAMETRTMDFSYVWEYQELRWFNVLMREYTQQVRGDITALNVYAPTEDKPDDTKDNFCVESECVFDQFLSTTYKFR